MTPSKLPHELAHVEQVPDHGHHHEQRSDYPYGPKKVDIPISTFQHPTHDTVHCDVTSHDDAKTEERGKASSWSEGHDEVVLLPDGEEKSAESHLLYEAEDYRGKVDHEGLQKLVTRCSSIVPKLNKPPIVAAAGAQVQQLCAVLQHHRHRESPQQHPPRAEAHYVHFFGGDVDIEKPIFQLC